MEKLKPRTKRGIFLDYSSEAKAYKNWLWDKRKIKISRYFNVAEDQPIEPVRQRDNPKIIV